MTIQADGKDVVVLSTDFQRTDGGKTWAIKCVEIPGFGQAVYAMEKTATSWKIVNTLDDSFDMRIFRDYNGDVVRWFKEYFIPKLNAWLATYITSGPTEFEQADILINSHLQFNYVDGLLVASYKA